MPRELGGLMNLFTRKKYIRGSLRKVKRKKGPDVWEYRYPDRSQTGSPLKAMTFSTADYPTKAAMWRHIDTLLWKLNSNTPQNISQELSFGGVCDRYILDEHLREIGRLKRGQQNTFGGLKFRQPQVTCRSLKTIFGQSGVRHP
jgi:hypothetical protein